MIVRTMASHAGRQPALSDLSKLAASAAAALSGFWLTIPGTVRDQTQAVVLMIAIDTLSGTWAAAAAGRLRSRTMIARMVGKAKLFVTLLALAAVPAFLLHNPGLLIAPMTGILAVEGASILENFVRLAKHEGVPLGPLRPALLSLEKYFAIESKEKETERPP